MTITDTARSRSKAVARRLGLSDQEPDATAILAGAAAGLIGGFVASLVLDGMQKVMKDPEERRKKQHASSAGNGAPQPQTGQRERHGGRRSRRQRHGLEGTSNHAHAQENEGSDADQAPEKVASVVAEKVMHRSLDPGERAAAGAAVHLGFGTLVGGLYGALAEVAPVVTIGMGTAYGSAVWALADEAAVPFLGLDKPPHQRPIGQHVQSFVGHLVYGSVLDLVRRGVRSVF